MFDETSGDNGGWVQIGTMQMKRSYLALSAINFNEIEAYCVTPSTATTTTTTISTISTWGPSFTMSMHLKVHSFTPPNMKNGAWAELLRLTTTDNDCCSFGDRAPAIFTHKDGYLGIRTQIGNNGNRAWSVTIQENRWYTLEMSQYKLHDKVGQL